ncbi:MAG: hypothetical protein QXQ41_03540 [Candidatus Bathyarchaeia archaeon]
MKKTISIFMKCIAAQRIYTKQHFTITLSEDEDPEVFQQLSFL